MPDVTNITALGALVALVLFLGWQLTSGRLWTKGQVDYMAAQFKETLTEKNTELNSVKAQRDADRETLGRMMTDLKAVLEQVLADRTAPTGRHGGPP